MPDWSLGAAKEPLPEVVSQPFDPGMFAVVIRGQDRFNSWELRDGHHPELSSTTGEGWVVRPLDSTLVPTEMKFLDRDGSLIEARTVSDPRPRTWTSLT